MQTETNIHRDRIVYDYPYGDTLTEREEALYWEATNKAEDAIARIAKVQERRQTIDGDIYSVLLSDEFRKLREATEQLQDAITTLHLLEKAAAWTENRNAGSTGLGEVFDGGTESE